MHEHRLPRGVIALGLVSLSMDCSSELIHSLLPVFLISVLGAGPAMLGMIEGIAEATASVMRIGSGVLSDQMRRRKPLLLLGYGLAALSKPLFPLAGSAATVLAARMMDRIGKGIRGAPRDALVADITPEALRGAAYGMRQSMDSVGAVLGPGLAICLMWLLHGNIQRVFWIAVVPAVVAVVILFLFVDETDRHGRAPAHGAPSMRWFGATALPGAYWRIIGTASVLMLARFSEAFLLLHAMTMGLAAAWVPVILVVMNTAYTLSSYPAGRLSDRVGRRPMLSLGIVLLMVANLVLAFAGSVWMSVLGAAIWGLHMGASQGLVSAMVADSAPASLRGVAFGWFHGISGVALLCASAIAGGLWSWLGYQATFIAGGFFALSSLFLLRTCIDAPPSRM